MPRGRPNRSGIDWSDPAAVREYHRAWKKRRPILGESRNGRPLGSGAATIRIAQRNQRGKVSGYYCFIGRAIWQEIGAPAFVTFDRYRSFVLIHACDPEWPGAHKVTGQSVDSIPRISASEAELTEYDLTIGVYAVSVVANMEIRISRAERERMIYDQDNQL